MPRFAQTNVESFLHNPAGKTPAGFCDVSRGINKYCAKARIVIGLAVQKQDAGLSGYCYLYLIGDFKSGATDEMFFSKEYEDMTLQFFLVIGG